MSKYAGVFMENGKFGTYVSEDETVEFPAFFVDGEEITIYINQKKAKEFAESILALVEGMKNE